MVIKSTEVKVDREHVVMRLQVKFVTLIYAKVVAYMKMQTLS